MSPNISEIMQLLVSHFWIVLLATIIFGLLLGFLIRGVLSKSHIRKAQVDRDIAETELAQTRDELDALYAAQRKRQAEAAASVSGNDQLSSELQEREQHIRQLGDQLAEARAELTRLQSQSPPEASAAEAQPAIEPQDTPPASAGADQELIDRNAWLESRVATLEAELDTAPAAAPDADAIAAAGALEEELAKLRWRNRYLEGRLAYYEESRSEIDEAAEASSTHKAEPAPEAANEDTPDLEVADITPADDPQDEEIAAADSLEIDTDELETEEPEPVAVAEEIEDAPSAEDDSDEGLSVAEESEVALSADEEDAGVVEEQDASLEADRSNGSDAVPESSAPHPSDAVLAALDDEVVNGRDAIEPVQPPVVDKPASDPDDLTAIGGIGPRIEEVLHGLGIWSYAQIAEWGPEHTAWIEQHLSFQGRIEREDWIGQAKALIEA